jgi:hypothetical protein
MAGTKVPLDESVVADRSYIVGLMNEKTGRMFSTPVTAKSDYHAIKLALFHNEGCKAVSIQVEFFIYGQCRRCKVFILTHSQAGYETQTHYCVDCRRMG